MPIAYAILVGVAPMVLGFLAGFFGVPWPGLTWAAYLGWLIVCLVVGAIIMIVRK